MQRVKYERVKVHNAALTRLYKSKNIGTDIKDRLIYWQSKTHFGGYTIFTSTQANKIKIYEELWLREKFPADFNMF